jgi:hypothetical protein
MDEALQSPRQEARGLLSLLALRQESLAGVRRLIRSRADIRYRQELEIAFDCLLLYASIPALRNGTVKILRHRNRVLKPSPALQAAILERLKQGQSRPMVARALGMRLSVVRDVAEQYPSADFRVGRGRKYSEQKIQQLVDELRTYRPCAVMRKHRCCAELTRRLRREFLNDHQDLRRLPQEEEIKRALLAGEYPSEVARRFAVGKEYVWRLRKKLGIFIDLRKRNKLAVSDAERAEIVEAGRAGEHVRTLAKRYHHHLYVIHDILAKGGIEVRRMHLFTAAERKRILASLAAGKTPGEISREVFSTTKFRSTIWLIRKRLQQGGTAWKTAAKAA